MFAHLLLPTDGSEFSEAAIRKGLRLAKECKSKVTALSVTPEFHVFTFDTTMLEDTRDRFLSDSKAQAEKNLAAVRRAAAEEGVVCDTVSTACDHPYQAIIDTAVTRGCDLIMMASHGRRGVQAMLLGSETQKVLTHTTIPVLVYR